MKSPQNSGIQGDVLSRPQRVYIVIVNWNGSRDTIECLESVLRLAYSNFCVVVCDNSSSDGSLQMIREWADGKVQAGCGNPQLQALTMPPVPKPIRYRYLGSSGVPASGCREPLVLIETGGNLGFAGGTNIGLRYALACGDMDYVWLLNNDTVVPPDALSRLVERMAERPDAGMCGSTLLYYHEPDKVQALGGSRYSRWVARGGHIGESSAAGDPISASWVESGMKYVVGASMLVSRSFLEIVGLMNENYFLYFEELDWAVRGRKSFKLAYSQDSIVYHKLGSSIGTAARTRDLSETAEYFATRNRLRFTLEHFPYAVPSVSVAIAASVVHRLLGGKWKNVRAIFRGILNLPAN